MEAKTKWRFLYSSSDDLESLSSSCSSHFQMEDLDKKGTKPPVSRSGFRPSQIRVKNTNNSPGKKERKILPVDKKPPDAYTHLNSKTSSKLSSDVKEQLLKLLEQKNAQVIQKYTTRPMSSSTRVMNFPSSSYYEQKSSEEHQKILSIIDDLEAKKKQQESSASNISKSLESYSSEDAIQDIQETLTTEEIGEKEESNEGEEGKSKDKVPVSTTTVEDEPEQSSIIVKSRPASAARVYQYLDPSTSWTSEAREAFKDPASIIQKEKEILAMGETETDEPDELIFIPKSSFFRKARNNWVHTNPKKLNVYNLSFKTSNSSYGSNNFNTRINRLERTFWS